MRIVKIEEVVFVGQKINAFKGIAAGTLLIIVVAIIIIAIIITILATQTNFVENAANILSNLLTIKLP